MVSRVIVDELHTLATKQRNSREDEGSTVAFPRHRCSTVIEGHAGRIHLYLMLDLGYKPPNLDEVLLWPS